MQLPLSQQLVPGLIALEECGSTNTELVARAGVGELPEFTTLVTTNQTQGRGRLDRVWVAPPGQTIAVSVLLRPVLPDGTPLGLDRYGWLSLIAGVAMARAVTGLVSAEHKVSLKWPNDVQIDGRKVSGLLAELLPDANGVVLGAGLNLTIAAADLPTPVATSLTLNGANPEGLADAALAAYLTELQRLYREFLRAGGPASIRHQVVALCSTLGQAVRVELPGGDELLGTAVDLDDSGRLRIRTGPKSTLVTVAAGDVTHVR